MTTLARRSAETPTAKSRAWAELSDADLKQRAAKAVGERDVAELWRLAEAYLYAYGSSGTSTSRNTVSGYKTAIRDLLKAWEGVNLVRPRRDEGLLYICSLEESVNPKTGKPVSPATVRVKLAGARLFTKHSDGQG